MRYMKKKYVTPFMEICCLEHERPCAGSLSDSSLDFGGSSDDFFAPGEDKEEIWAE